MCTVFYIKNTVQTLDIPGIICHMSHTNVITMTIVFVNKILIFLSVLFDAQSHQATSPFSLLTFTRYITTYLYVYKMKHSFHQKYIFPQNNLNSLH